MKANVKGFIRNTVHNVVYELAKAEYLVDGDGEYLDETDFQDCPEVMDIVRTETENMLDCIIEEDK